MAQLKELHVPAPISWWPLAPGWWLLAGLLIAVVVAGITWWYLRRRRTAYRRAGLRLLKRLNASDYSTQQLARQLNEILKRTALAAPCYRQLGLAAAHGNPWANFLRGSCPHYPDKDALTAQLVKALYQPNVNLDASALQDFCRFWIAHHQPLAPAPAALPEVHHAAA